MANKRSKKTQTWVAVGAIILIALLLVWLTMADLWGDTDVAACVTALPAIL
ncbi:MAG: hypothetical protein K2J97_01400 [Muribaculaceae bacterium]|nr:hypothetical protein [Muribaculaceae bacterium]MDE6644726.1 hypothetical protein [Muribaculaceae bacterium]